MRRGELADLSAFVAVADNLSFRAAAARLGVTPSALSHTVRQLEERLGVRLLNRTTRSVAPTDAGRRLLQRLRPAMDQIAGALDDLNGERSRPFGRLRIYATHLAGAAVLAPVWARFLATYPDVHLEVALDDAATDIVARGFDAGIGSRDLAAADMVAVRVMEPMKVAVVGAPAYLAGRRQPLTPDDLAEHDCIQFRRGSDGPIFDWGFERGGRSRRVSIAGRLMVNDPRLCVRAAVDGLGIAYTIEALAEPFLRSGELVRLLDDWSPCFQGMFLYYPGHRQVPAPLRALIDILRIPGSVPARKRSAIANPFCTQACHAAVEDGASRGNVAGPRDRAADTGSWRRAGHSVGDEVLDATPRRARPSVRPTIL
jgi:DNA-binding transcriptional LysR family regulator